MKQTSESIFTQMNDKKTQVGYMTLKKGFPKPYYTGKINKASNPLVTTALTNRENTKPSTFPLF